MGVGEEGEWGRITVGPTGVEGCNKDCNNLEPYTPFHTLNQKTRSFIATWITDMVIIKLNAYFMPRTIYVYFKNVIFKTTLCERYH